MCGSGFVCVDFPWIPYCIFCISSQSAALNRLVHLELALDGFVDFLVGHDVDFLRHRLGREELTDELSAGEK